MIDIKKIREENSRFLVGSRTVYKLCDEVDRIRKSHEVAHNLYVATWDQITKLEKDLSHLIKVGMEKDLQIEALLDALVAKRGSS